MLDAMFIENIKQFFQDNKVLRIILDGYFLLFLVSLVVYIGFKYRKGLFLIIIGLIISAIAWFSQIAGLEISSFFYQAILASYLIIVVVILAPEIRKHMEFHKGDSISKQSNISSTQATIEAVADAVFDMSAVKVGALITIEQHISLEQYSERAIPLNSDISKELLFHYIVLVKYAAQL